MSATDRRSAAGPGARAAAAAFVAGLALAQGAAPPAHGAPVTGTDSSVTQIESRAAHLATRTGADKTTVSGFSLRNRVPAGFVEREAFRVTGPATRLFVLQYRTIGGRWTVADRAQVVEGRGVVRLRVDRQGDQCGWQVRRQGTWERVVQTPKANVDWRVRLPAAGTYAMGRSGPERARVYEATSSPAAPRTNVRPETARQVVLADRTDGIRGDFRRFQWSARQHRWLRVGSATAVFGSNGVVPGALREQGSRTTPAGTYRLLHAFGAGDPGSKMRYRSVTSCSYWVLDPAAGDYNRRRESCANPPRSGEHLLTYVERGPYHHAVVTDYNYHTPTRSGGGSGGAIFLHYASSYTGGCVGVTSLAELTRTVQWLDPDREPVIVIRE